MSNIEAYRQAKDVVLLCEADFVSLSDQQTWAKESRYALQTLQNNGYLTTMSLKNLDSLRSAIINIAAVGLTLNPIKRHAYLIPRDGKICLDIGYLGYQQMAIDSGVFSYIKADIVFERDSFISTGVGREPQHEFDPFTERGEIVGAYCVAKTIGGDFITEIMPINEIYAIRDRSQSWKAGKNSPWKSDPGQMIKKTVIRRAYKAWPIPSNAKTKMETAMDQDIDDINDIGEVTVSASPEKEPLLEAIKEQLFIMDKTIEETIVFCGKLYQRKIEALEELTKYELEKLTAMLAQKISKMSEEEVTRKQKDYHENQRTDSEDARDIPVELELETD